MVVKLGIMGKKYITMLVNTSIFPVSLHAVQRMNHILTY